MTKLFQSTVLQVLNNRCHCNISTAFIHADHLLCDSTAPSQVVYRATIDSIGNYSSTTIVGYIDEWIRGGANLTNGINLVTFDSNCSVQINPSDPPCNGSSMQSNQEPPSTLTLPTQPLLTTTNIVLCAVVVLLVTVLVAVLILGGSIMWCYRSHQQTLIPVAKRAGDPPLRQR